MKKFQLVESPYNQGKYIIKANPEALGIECIGKGSYNVLPARVCNLSFPQYLKMCRDVYGAEIIGKEQLYPTAYFNNDSKSKKLVDLLNSLI